MAGPRLMTVDRTPATSLVVCRCGWRELVTDKQTRIVMDRHRRDSHPAQAASLAAHRQARGT
jgi:hypothetical protein